MKKNYKNGFTLVELLAVLVVLAILSLIAIPVVIKIIDNVREDSYKRSIEGYVRSAEYAISLYMSKNPFVDLSSIAMDNDKINFKVDSEVININSKGNQVSCMNVRFDAEGKINLSCCFTEESQKQSKYYTYNNGKITECSADYCPYKKYDVGSEIIINREKYYVIDPSDKTKDYVTVLKDIPLTVIQVSQLGFNVNYNYNDYAAVRFSDNSQCGNGSDDSGCQTSYDKSTIRDIVNAWMEDNFHKNELKEIDGYRSRLITQEELEKNLGYDREASPYPSQNGQTPSWVYNHNYSYWTMSSRNDVQYNVWYIDQSLGAMYSHFAYLEYAIRPVINVYKDAIEN